jgi:hypothetical protein
MAVKRKAFINTFPPDAICHIGQKRQQKPLYWRTVIGQLSTHNVQAVPVLILMTAQGLIVLGTENHRDLSSGKAVVSGIRWRVACPFDYPRFSDFGQQACQA